MTERSLSKKQRMYFRARLREARARVLKDAEDFMEVPLVLERLGSYLTPGRRGLNSFAEPIAELAESSPLADDVPREWPEFHRPLENLYELVRVARNEVAHEGAHARQMSTRAVELAIVLEDALMDKADRAADFMVAEPEEAHPWEPLSFLRQKMLVNSFTYLPVWMEVSNDERWWLLSDGELAGYLRAAGKRGDRDDRLSEQLVSAVRTGELNLLRADTCHADRQVSELAEEIDQHPWLVVENGRESNLIGILTAFDLL